MPKRKALKVVVDVELHAVTCPGVFLPDREDVFIDIDIFGHRKRTQCHPPVFPFLFHEKIRFEKVFANATDPVQVAQELSAESVQIELIQLSYPGGELLGTYEDNARDFLFPTPKVSPTYPGVDREVLLQRSASFPGIAPKLEFSSRTTIKEVTSSGRSTASEKKKKERAPNDLMNGGVTHETKLTSKTKPKQMYSSKKKKTKSTANDEPRRGRSSQRAKSASRGTTMWGYEQPTIASRARSPSPYTRRRMAELSISDPFESAAKRKPFKTEIDSRPDFVVRKVQDDALSLERTPPPPRTPSYERKSPRHSGRSRNSYLSPRRNVTGSPRMASYNSACSQSSDEAASSEGSSSSELEALVDKFSSGAARLKPWHCYSSIGNYLSNYKDRFRNRTTPSPDRSRMGFSRSMPNSPRFSRHSHIEEESRQYLGPSLPYHKQRIKPCLVTRSTPNSARSSKEVPRTAASRITVGIENILHDVRRSEYRNQNLYEVSRRNSVRKKNERVRFQDTSDMNTSLRCARGTPAGSRPSSSHSYSATVSPRRTDPSFSLADLDTVPPSVGRRRLSPSSILLRTPLEDRLKAQPSPYEKIRDRVRALLSSPRATQIADNIMYEGEERYRQHLSRTPSPRSPRMSVPITDTDYWNEKASEYTGKSHRKLFEENLGKIHADIYNTLRSSD